MSQKILVTQSSMPPLDEYVEEISSIFESHCLTNAGPKHQALEKELQSYLEVPNVSLFVNGHSAIESAIELFDLHGEIITTPFTFASTTNAIIRTGASPVFCDIKKDDLTIDPSKIEALITENTTGIMPVHVYGNICDVEAIGKIARKYNLKVIYDAAHAFGVEKDGASVLQYGDASALSFHATKVFNTIEGGALVYGNPNLRDSIIALRNFGMRDEDIKFAGGNCKMNEFCAAMGLCNLKHIDAEIEKRRIVFSRYCENLFPLRHCGVRIPGIDQHIKRNYAYFPVLFDEEVSGVSRDQIFESLKSNGIFARKYFYPLTSLFSCASSFNKKETPVASAAAASIIALPMYADLSIREVDFISKVIIDELK